MADDACTAILTDLVREADNEGMKNLLANTQDWKNADQGAATLVVAAFDPALNGKLLAAVSSIRSESRIRGE